jgi:osmotically-inducible protein OsmY
MTRSAALDDHRLREAVSRALDASPDVTADHIGVGVNEGAVVLSGLVRSYSERSAAIEAVLTVPGVVGVADDIAVERSAGGHEDADLARTLTRLLKADAVVRDGRVRATVRDQRVTLIGEVPGADERAAVEQLVNRIPGVALVINLITVSSRRSSTGSDSFARSADPGADGSPLLSAASR